MDVKPHSIYRIWGFCQTLQVVRLDFKLVWNVLATQYTQYSKYKSTVSTAECSSPSKCSPQTSVIRQLFLSNLRPQCFAKSCGSPIYPVRVSIRVQCLASDLSECLANIPSKSKYKSTVFSHFRVSDLSECFAKSCRSPIYPVKVSIRVQCLALDLSECLADIPSTVSIRVQCLATSDLSEC